MNAILLQFDGPAAGEAFLVGRAVFGLVVAFTGLNHFTNTDSMAGYAEAKGLPMPRAGVLVSGGLLVVCGLAVVGGAFPAVAAGGIALFMLVSAVVFHDFWAAPDDQAQDEMTQFLKNAMIFGASVVLLALSNVAWPYALSLRL